MVQVVENWTQVEGVVQAVAPDSASPEHAAVDLAVDAVAPVRGDDGREFPNLLADAAGSTVTVVVARASAPAGALEPRRRLRLRVRRAGPQRIVAHPEHVE